MYSVLKGLLQCNMSKLIFLMKAKFIAFEKLCTPRPHIRNIECIECGGSLVGVNWFSAL